MQILKRELNDADIRKLFVINQKLAETAEFRTYRMDFEVKGSDGRWIIKGKSVPDADCRSAIIKQHENNVYIMIRHYGFLPDERYLVTPQINELLQIYREGEK